MGIHMWGNVFFYWNVCQLFKGKDAHRYETKFSSLKAPVFLLVQICKGEKKKRKKNWLVSSTQTCPLFDFFILMAKVAEPAQSWKFKTRHRWTELWKYDLYSPKLTLVLENDSTFTGKSKLSDTHFHQLIADAYFLSPFSSKSSLNPK